MLTERSMPIPVKITAAGGYDCRTRISVKIQGESCHIVLSETYQRNGAANGRRKRVDDFHGGVQQPCQPIIATRLVERRDLLSKCGNNVIRRTASLKCAK